MTLQIDVNVARDDRLNRDGTRDPSRVDQLGANLLFSSELISWRACSISFFKRAKRWVGTGTDNAKIEPKGS